MDTLAEIVKKSIWEYAGGGPNLKTIPFANEDQAVYGVIAIDNPIRQTDASIVVLARLEANQVIIEEDNTTRPLFEVLMQHGIPREKIIMSYAGENSAELIPAS